MHVRPPRGLLRDLRISVCELIGSGGGPLGPTSTRTLLEACLDIASACEQRDDGRCPPGSRFGQQEKALLFELMQSLRLDPHAPVPED